MWKKLFADGDFMSLPQITLVFFIATFVMVVIWVMRASRKGHWSRMSQLPLESSGDDTGVWIDGEATQKHSKKPGDERALGGREQ